MATSVTFKFKPAEQAANRLERVAERSRLALAALDAVNAVTRRADESLRRGEIEDINLTPAYVKSKTDVQLARPGAAPRAVITTKGDLTILGRFAPLSRLVNQNRRDSIGRRLGFRSAGTALAIRKSKREVQPQWFLMRLRRGNAPGDNFGVFVRDDALPAKNGPNPSLAGGRHRDGRAGKRQIYGPSPYSLFRAQVTRQFDTIQSDLARTALREVGDELEKGVR